MKEISNFSIHIFDKFRFSLQYFKNFFKTSQQQETKKPKKKRRNFFLFQNFEKKELKSQRLTSGDVFSTFDKRKWKKKK